MKYLLSIASLLVILLLSAPASGEIYKTDQKAVLITGATTGIGRATAEHLAAKGYFVYAGARKDADIEALNQIENIMAVRLDVTKQDQVDEAVRLIEAQGRGLWGLVNNAGVAVFAPLTVASEADARFMFDVNVFGVLRVTQAFAPMIVESKGRIVNISSISGVWSSTIAGMYSASKHSLEAMTDALALELGELGVHVAAVNPGAFASAGFAKDCTQMLEDTDADWGSLEDSRQWLLDRCNQQENASTSPDPIAVALTIEQALFEDGPRDQYLVASQQGAGETIAWAVIEMLALNIGHEHSYTRDEIVEFVDLIWPYMSGEKSWNSLEEEWAFQDSWIQRRQPDVD